MLSLALTTVVLLTVLSLGLMLWPAFTLRSAPAVAPDEAPPAEIPAAADLDNDQSIDDKPAS